MLPSLYLWRLIFDRGFSIRGRVPSERRIGRSMYPNLNLKAGDNQPEVTINAAPGN